YTEEEIIESFLLQYYSKRDIPIEIIVPIELKEEEINISKFITDKKGIPIVIRTPKNEDEERLMNMALKDLTIESLKSEKVWLALSELQKVFHLSEIPNSIEGFDISNLQGKEAVGSRVYFSKGQPDKSKYRRYKIKYTEEIPNDYLMLQEVMRRRLKRIDEDPLADIILIDGGKGQLNIALKIKRELNLPYKFISIAKENEILYYEDFDDEIVLPKNSDVLQLFQKIRDEAHRFAKNYFEKLLRKGELEG
ncbi:MAG: excinuclease ABC subunit C, partial [Dictyoglomus sp.]